MATVISRIKFHMELQAGRIKSPYIGTVTMEMMELKEDGTLVPVDAAFFVADMSEDEVFQLVDEFWRKDGLSTCDEVSPNGATNTEGITIPAELSRI